MISVLLSPDARSAAGVLGRGEGMTSTPGSPEGWVKVQIRFGVWGLVFVLVVTSPAFPLIDPRLLGRLLFAISANRGADLHDMMGFHQVAMR